MFPPSNFDGARYVVPVECLLGSISIFRIFKFLFLVSFLDLLFLLLFLEALFSFLDKFIDFGHDGHQFFIFGSGLCRLAVLVRLILLKQLQVLLKFLNLGNVALDVAGLVLQRSQFLLLHLGHLDVVAVLDLILNVADLALEVLLELMHMQLHGDDLG